MQTSLPPAVDDEPSSPPPARPSGTAAPPDERGWGAGAAAIVVAVLALVLASVAVIVGRDDDGGGGGGAAGTATIDLTEFALTPDAVTVPAGGSLKVVNSGSSPHNLTISGTDIATADLAAGDSETLDLGALEPGEYDILCSISGHADAGMTGTLTVTEAGAPSAAATGDTTAAGGGHAGHQLTEADYEEMSRAMDESIAGFPAETEGTGNPVLEPAVKEGGIKEFELTAAITPWEVEPGRFVDAWSYNGVVPGPQIRVAVGDRVRVVLHNDLPMATDLHLHGINVENAMDGVAPITQESVKPGETFTYEFVADETAVAMYHAHHHGQMQVPNGLFGTILVGQVPLPAGQTISGYAIPADLKVSQELPLVLNDSGVIGYSLNGKSFPATAPLTAAQGDWILVHYYNEGGQIHPMHLHQFDQVVVAKDGYKLDQPYVVDTLNVAPGERYSVLVKLDKPGTWVWHCHILNHVERETGMFGMVTAVVVT
ncbi:MAG TPA: multicopper oxidase domain-containing protein [Acidimicrobiales bacterium]|nr:multicopper oxidase domain-containing protein [Acidimicrobiales bacterium]